MSKEKGKNVKNFLKGIIAENPLFVSILGTCPALATTKSLEAAIGMGFLFTIVLICSSVLVSLLRKLISEEIRTPAYIVIIATFVTIVKMMANAFLPELYSTLGVFISLIVVNCIVLGRAEAYASKNTVKDSLIDALGMGVGYTLAIMLMAIFREFLGTGGFTFGVIFTFIPEVSWFLAFIKNRKVEKKAALEKLEKLRKAEEAKKAAAAQAQVVEGGNK